MKPKLTIGLSVLISLILLLFGLVYGNVSGYADERAHVNALLEGDSGLLTVVGYRASDALNLCVVAGRHLTGDTDVEALCAAAKALRQEAQPLDTVKAEDAALSDAFAAVARKLAATASLKQSERDTQYLDMLSSDFEEYGQSEIFNTYNQAAAEFNEKLSTPVMGDVARFFGVKALVLYQ